MNTEKKFVGRLEELKTLNREYVGEESSFVIVFGRRRVGKTALINEFISKHPGNSLYFLATQESIVQNCKAFCEQVADFTGNEFLKHSNLGWIEIFKFLAEFPMKDKKIIVLDEFQYLGKSDSAFPSIMQKIWDTILKNSNVMLILCGSLISLMQQQTLDYSSPLYGRRTAQICLKQIPFCDYSVFFNHKSEEELIPYYAVTGGVPKYIELFSDCKNIEDGIENYILNPQCYLYEEPYFLLQNEVTEIGSYFSLIRTISKGNRKISDISSVLGVKQTSIPKYLGTLINLGLVEREVPITELNPEKSKSGLYRIKDNFIDFWFKFVYPYRSFLERGEKKYVMTQIRKMFLQNYVSFVYEDICREKMWKFSSHDLWNFRFDRLGRYWGPICGETDIVGLNIAEKKMIIGECKYTEAEKGLSIFHALQEKAIALEKFTECKCQAYTIFSTSGFSEGLLEEAARNSEITLIDTFTPRK